MANTPTPESRRDRTGTVSLSIVVPMYNEADGLDALFKRLMPIVHEITPEYEIICVNDGSDDSTLDGLVALCGTDPRIKVIDLARNFGKEIALTAGLAHASGDVVIPIDADLQDPPEVMKEMVDRWRDGYDMVIGVRADRSSDSLGKRTTAALFYRLLGTMSDVPIPANAGDFRLLDRRVVEVLRTFPERTRFMKGLFASLGFRQTFVEFSREARAVGTGKWRTWKLWNFALEGIFSFSTLPLRMWTYFGFSIALLSLAFMVYIVIDTLIYGNPVAGYPSLLAVLLFATGLQLVGIGILGEYLGRVFIEVKRRPLYIVREAYGFEVNLASVRNCNRPVDVL
jgi:glycosyltransferase involved in cell wall biosynthesis